MERIRRVFTVACIMICLSAQNAEAEKRCTCQCETPEELQALMDERQQLLEQGTDSFPIQSQPTQEEDAFGDNHGEDPDTIEASSFHEFSKNDAEESSHTPATKRRWTLPPRRIEFTLHDDDRDIREDDLSAEHEVMGSCNESGNDAGIALITGLAIIVTVSIGIRKRKTRKKPEISP